VAFRRRSILSAAIVAACLAAAHAAAGAAPTRWIVFSAEPGGTGLAQLFRIQTTGA
jgi:hypothetical protein